MSRLRFVIPAKPKPKTVRLQTLSFGEVFKFEDSRNPGYYMKILQSKGFNESCYDIPIIELYDGSLTYCRDVDVIPVNLEVTEVEYVIHSLNPNTYRPMCGASLKPGESCNSRDLVTCPDCNSINELADKVREKRPEEIGHVANSLRGEINLRAGCSPVKKEEEVKNVKRKRA